MWQWEVEVELSLCVQLGCAITHELNCCVCSLCIPAQGGEGLYRSVVDNLASCVEEDAAGQLLWVRSLQACVHVLTKEEDLLVGTALR